MAYDPVKVIGPPPVLRLAEGGTTTRYKDYQKQMGDWSRRALENDPAYKAYLKETGNVNWNEAGGSAPAYTGKSWSQEILKAQSPEVRADYETARQAVNKDDKRSFKGRLGSTLKVVVPALVGGAALAGTGLLGAGLQGAVNPGAVAGAGSAAGGAAGAGGGLLEAGSLGGTAGASAAEQAAINAALADAGAGAGLGGTAGASSAELAALNAALTDASAGAAGSLGGTAAASAAEQAALTAALADAGAAGAGSSLVAPGLLDTVVNAVKNLLPNNLTPAQIGTALKGVSGAKGLLDASQGAETATTPSAATPNLRGTSGYVPPGIVPGLNLKPSSGLAAIASQMRPRGFGSRGLLD